MNRFLFSIVIFALLLSACGPAAGIASSSLRRETDPQVPDADLKSLVAGNNTFALDLYRSVRINNGNLVVSPYSISVAFAMAYAGARGDTASQIASAFHFDLPDTQLHPAFNALDLGLADATKVKVQGKDRKSPQLNIANAMWAQKDYPFQAPFLDTLGSNYGAGVRLVDFAGNPQGVRETVNNWVERETRGKIKDVAPEGGFDQDTRLILINAIYFQADWLTVFEETINDDFLLLDGSHITVPTMTMDPLHVPYAKGENWTAVELPYAGETFAMDIIVPDDGQFLNLESKMDYPFVSNVLSSLSAADVALGLPKFQFTNDFALLDELEPLGISDAFNSAIADFSGMTGRRDLALDQAIQKTYICVDEEGTTAAAVTELTFQTISETFSQSIPVYIDRPFIFLIRELKTGQILFIGRVLDPRK